MSNPPILMNPHQGNGPAYNIDHKDASERMRSVVLIFALIVGLGIVGVYFFGESIVNSVTNQAKGSYMGIGIALILALIVTSIISSVLKGIFNSIKLTSGFKDITENQSLTPAVRIGFKMFMLFIAVVIFFVLMNFMAKNQIFEQINNYPQNGFNFNFELFGQERVIKFENGELEIE